MVCFEMRIREHLRPLERYIRFRINNPQDTEDILQEVLLAAYRGEDAMKNSEMLKPWLVGIAKNKCNDYFRAKAKRMEIPLESLDETALRPASTALRHERLCTKRWNCSAIPTSRSCTSAISKTFRSRRSPDG